MIPKSLTLASMTKGMQFVVVVAVLNATSALPPMKMQHSIYRKWLNKMVRVKSLVAQN